MAGNPAPDCGIRLEDHPLQNANKVINCLLLFGITGLIVVCGAVGYRFIASYGYKSNRQNSQKEQGNSEELRGVLPV